MSLERRSGGPATATVNPVDRDLVLEAIDAIEVVEAREVIELAIVRLAAVRRTQADLERLRMLLLGMRRSRRDPVAFAEFDFAFHVALGDAARNTFLANSLAALHDGMREMIARYATTAVADARMGELIDSHAELVEAVDHQNVHRASVVYSDMMAALRVESGRCWPRLRNRMMRQQVSQIGMLDTMTHEKGDRP
jgi:DNA-binding FadR family transcriptional regulator